MARVQLTICRHNTQKLLQWKNGHVTVVGLSGPWNPLLNITNIIYMTTAVSRILNILCIMFKIIECILLQRYMITSLLKLCCICMYLDHVYDICYYQSK